jgi:hypothetical protein
MSPKERRKKNMQSTPRAEPYRHPEAENLLRPEVGAQPYFRKKKPPVGYCYES